MRLDIDNLYKYHIKSAEGMRNAILQCRRHGLARVEWEYYLSQMMYHAQAAIDRKLGRSRILRDAKDWT